ncbi:hypothetical protein D3C81_1977780 [compost metagenome]
MAEVIQVLAGATQDPGVEFGDQTIGFGDPDETVRGEQAVLWMLPADEGFELGHLAATQVEDGLVVELQPIVFD